MNQSKGESEVVIRWTDNTMAKRKRTKGKTMVDKALHRKQKIEHYEHNELGCSGSI